MTVPRRKGGCPAREVTRRLTRKLPQRRGGGGRGVEHQREVRPPEGRQIKVWGFGNLPMKGEGGKS